MIRALAIQGPRHGEIIELPDDHSPFYEAHEDGPAKGGLIQIFRYRTKTVAKQGNIWTFLIPVTVSEDTRQEAEWLMSEVFTMLFREHPAGNSVVSALSWSIESKPSESRTLLRLQTLGWGVCGNGFLTTNPVRECESHAEVRDEVMLKMGRRDAILGAMEHLASKHTHEHVVQRLIERIETSPNW